MQNHNADTRTESRTCGDQNDTVTFSQNDRNRVGVSNDCKCMRLFKIFNTQDEVEEPLETATLPPWAEEMRSSAERRLESDEGYICL
jgi:hypothetical protein